MTEAMPFLQKCDITFLRPPPIKPRERKKENPGIRGGLFFRVRKNAFLIC